MEWKEISETLVLAFNLLIGDGDDQNWICDAETFEPTREYYSDRQFQVRDLYDFFDEQKIFIDIDHEFGEYWDFTIDEGGTGHSGDETVYSTRSEAETAAFSKAFKILNDKLKNNE